MGTMSGSAVANVATTGTLTIPLMMRIGYRPAYAGAVEAAASTGGMIMPPVMGTAAFIMVEYLSTSYLRIITAAVIPAALYYFAVFLQIHLAARKDNLTGMEKTEIPDLWTVIRNGGHLLVPIVMMVVTLFVSGRTAIFAGGMGILWALTIIFSGERRMFPVGMMLFALAAHALTAALIPEGFRMQGGEAPLSLALAWIVNFSVFDSIYLVTLLATSVSFGMCIFRRGGLLTGVAGMLLLFGAFYLTSLRDQLFWLAFPAGLAAWLALRRHAQFYGAMSKLYQALLIGVRASVPVSVACAIVGFIIGVAQSTSLSAVFAQNIVYLSGGVLLFGLLFTMVAALVSSLGLPATAVYIVVITVVIETLKNLGVSDFPAHMFVFYFGILSNVTPPVALASYTAAAICGATPWEVGWTGFRLTLAGFIIPFMFVYQPMLLMEGAVFPDVLFYVTGAVLAVFAIAVAGEGFLWQRFTILERVVMLGSSVFFAFPGVIAPKLNAWFGGTTSGSPWPVAAVGAALLFTGVVSQWIRKSRNALASLRTRS